MTRDVYDLIESYMQTCMTDNAHDCEHIYRVLYVALDIARTEPDADRDVLICACLLHDIGRMEQFENPALDHAQVGADKALRFLREHGFDDEFARRVSDCIRAHRYRAANPPRSIEAQILFDADKIDVSGAIGIARTLIYDGQVGEPLYTLGFDGQVLDGQGDAAPSFFHEYRFKLEKLYGRFYTARAAQIAAQRRLAAEQFYHNLLDEVRGAYRLGADLLKDELK